MREILFRAKRIDNGEWVQGSLFAEGTRFEIVRGTCNTVGIEGVEVVPETIGQYTCLTDKNGKQIFEGDIVLDHYWNIRGVVTFCRGTFTSGLRAYNGWVLKRADGTVEDCELVIYDDNDFEIIGNIYDNPEILSN